VCVRSLGSLEGVFEVDSRPFGAPNGRVSVVGLGPISNYGD